MLPRGSNTVSVYTVGIIRNIKKSGVSSNGASDDVDKCSYACLGFNCGPRGLNQRLNGRDGSSGILIRRESSTKYRCSGREFWVKGQQERKDGRILHIL